MAVAERQPGERKQTGDGGVQGHHEPRGELVQYRPDEQ
jgi:hypothetical protein